MEDKDRMNAKKLTLKDGNVKTIVLLQIQIMKNIGNMLKIHILEKINI